MPRRPRRRTPASRPRAGGARSRIAALVALPLGAAGLYLALGSPALPGQPLGGARVQDQSIESLVAQVEAHLRANPDDGRGWEVIAPVYLRLGRFDDAVQGAAQRACACAARPPSGEADLGEALVAAANGVVTAEAKAAFERAVALDARERQGALFPRPRRRAGRPARRRRGHLARACWPARRPTRPGPTSSASALARVDGRPGPAGPERARTWRPPPISAPTSAPP